MSTCRSIGAAALGVLLLSAPASAQRSFGRIITLGTPEGVSARALLLGRFDDEAPLDACIATWDGKRRALEIRPGRAATADFAPTATARLPLPADVSAWCIADLHEDPGDEVVLLNASGAFLWRPRASGRERLAKLFAVDFLFQIADPATAFAFPRGVVDLDQDGLRDLLLPIPDGVLLARQTRGKDGVRRFETRACRLPEDERSLAYRLLLRERGREARRGLKDGFRVGGQLPGQRSGSLLAISESAPLPHLLDWDGDGDRDLLMQGRAHLFVHPWPQTMRGEGTDAQKLPVAADRSRRLDVSYRVLAGELDRDGRADVVLVVGDRRSKEIRSQVLVYRQAGRGPGGAGDPFGRRGRPDQLLLIKGFVGVPQVRDIDGDGRDDLAIGVMRPDLFDRISGGGDARVEARLHVHLMGDRGLSQEPSFSTTVKLPGSGLGRVRDELVVRFLADLDGDGLSELLLRSDPEHLRIVPPRKRGRAIELSAEGRALLEMRLHRDDRIAVLSPRGPLVVSGPGGLRLVTFPSRRRR